MSCANDDPKGVLRREILGRLATLGQAEIARRSALACGHLVERYGDAEVVMGYLALPGETDPSGALGMLRARGARVAAPRVDWESRAMVPAVLPDSRGELVTTRHGLREPPAHAEKLVIDSLDLVIVPGVAFTASGGRLGRGAGFYDRFLGSLPGTTRTVGLILSCQIVETIPMEAHDQRVGAVITEDGLLAG